MDDQYFFLINDSKTKITIFRSPLLKQNLSDLSISVGDTQVSPPSKVRDLGIVFDQYLTLHDHGIVVFVSLLIFTFLASVEFGNLLTFDATAQLIHASLLA